RPSGRGSTSALTANASCTWRARNAGKKSRRRTNSAPIAQASWRACRRKAALWPKAELRRASSLLWRRSFHHLAKNLLRASSVKGHDEKSLLARFHSLSSKADAILG